MKIIILCGGLGTRLGLETKMTPKPMVKIGGKPILEHIINIYTKYGFKHFILALGYKGKIIQEYFKNNSNIKCVNTGLKSNTGARLYKLKKYFNENENFMLTYGDGLSNQNIKKLLNFHIKHKKIGTITAVRPPARFGEVIIKKKILVDKFQEKPRVSSSWINGGFFVFNYKIFNYINDTNEIFEYGPLVRLVKAKQLTAYKHKGFWQCMDTPRDRKLLDKIIRSKNTTLSTF
jgi:glucose-1-phosphate cytidylyltransferase